MNSFEYYNPVKVVFGVGEVDKIGREISGYGKRALIVSYNDVSFFGDLFERIHELLTENNVSAVDYFGATANPTIAELVEGIRIGKKEAVDVVIAVGGGSAMDLGKAIAAGILYPYEDIRRMFLFSHSDDEYQISPQEALPILLIPTLPATASEMNATSVITDEETLRKSYVWDPCLYPKVSILDPTLTVSLPVYQTACGAIDSISHVAESFLFSDEDVYGNTDLQDNMQIAVMKTIYGNLERILKDPSNVSLRGVMQWSSTVCLNGWLSCGVFGWAPMHQMGHVLSSHFNATHGATLACMMLAWMRYFSSRSQNERFVKFAKLLFNTEDVQKAADIFEKDLKEFGVQTRITDFGCTKDDIDSLIGKLVDVSFGKDAMLASIPKISKEEARKIYELSL